MKGGSVREYVRAYVCVCVHVSVFACVLVNVRARVSPEAGREPG